MLSAETRIVIFLFLRNDTRPCDVVLGFHDTFIGHPLDIARLPANDSLRLGDPDDVYRSKLSEEGEGGL